MSVIKGKAEGFFDVVWRDSGICGESRFDYGLHDVLFHELWRRLLLFITEFKAMGNLIE